MARKKSNNLKFECELDGNDLKFNILFKEGQEEDITILLLCMINQELYKGTLYYIKNLFDTKQITEAQYQTVMTTLSNSLKLMQSQSPLAIKPSQVFR